jgi:hypothetical protein
MGCPALLASAGVCKTRFAQTSRSLRLPANDYPPAAVLLGCVTMGSRKVYLLHLNTIFRAHHGRIGEILVALDDFLDKFRLVTGIVHLKNVWTEFGTAAAAIAEKNVKGNRAFHGHVSFT